MKNTMGKNFKLFHFCFEFVESESNIRSLFWSDYLCQQSARNQQKQLGCRVLGKTPCHAAALLRYPFLGTVIVLPTTKFSKVYKVDLLRFVAFVVHVCTQNPRKIVIMVDLLSTRFCAHCIANRSSVRVEDWNLMTNLDGVIPCHQVALNLS